jgi:hypothetical protein
VTRSSCNSWRVQSPTLSSVLDLFLAGSEVTERGVLGGMNLKASRPGPRESRLLSDCLLGGVGMTIGKLARFCAKRGMASLMAKRRS